MLSESVTKLTDMMSKCEIIGEMNDVKNQCQVFKNIDTQTKASDCAEKLTANEKSEANQKQMNCFYCSKSISCDLFGLHTGMCRMVRV